MEQTVANKDKELTEAHQLNIQLQARIRELEKSLEEGSAEPTTIIKRDSHNSNQPPSLDLPWVQAQKNQKFTEAIRLKRRRSARS